MDGPRFDDLARTLTSTTRRGALRLLAGGALGAALGLLGPGEAGANHNGCTHVGKRCARDRQCCNRRCRGPAGRKTCRLGGPGTCRAGEDGCGPAGGNFPCNQNASCSCYVTMAGAVRCGEFDTEGAVCGQCTTDAQCRALGFSRHSFCARDTGACCFSPTTQGFCWEPCG